MPPDPRLEDEDDEYESSADDSDFAPEAAGDENAQSRDSDSASDSSDDEGQDKNAASSQGKPKPKKRKRAADGADTEDVGFENSGDEAIISKGEKKKKKKQKKRDDGAGSGKHGAVVDEDDEGGEGGLVKTRSMRAQEKEERKVAAVSGPVTVDVEALWAQMMAGPTTTTTTTEAQATAPEPPATEQDGADSMDVDRPPASDAQAAGKTSGDPSSMVRIKRTYNFAGQVHTEEKLVPRDSAEAKLHFAASKDRQKDADGAAEDGEDADPDGDPPRPRVLKKAFRSAFEPAIEISAPLRSDLNLGVTVTIKAREDKSARAKKLNTVEKSRMDWAGYVDQEGLKDELELAGKSKGSYAERQGFLARSEARREDDAWKARMKARA